MFRDLTEADVKLIQDMSEQMIALSKHRVLDGFTPTKETVCDYLSNPNKKLLIAVDEDNEPAGFCCFDVVQLENVPHSIARLVAIYVVPFYQGRGLATQMRKAFEEWAKDKDVCGYNITVSTGADLSSAGYEAYEVMWFKRI